MFIEFENSIREILISPEFKVELLRKAGQLASLTSEGVEPNLTQIDFSKIDFTIEPCPKNIDSDLACNVCFVLAKILKSSLAIEIKPIELQALILALYAGTTFELSLGGDGYINAKRTSQFFKILLNKLLKQKPAAENIIDQLFSIQKLKASKSDDVQKLLAIYQQSGATNQVQARELRLVLLAAFAKVELDVNNYLNQVAGSENLPWYFKRFLEDSGKLQQEIAESFVIQDEFVDDKRAAPSWLLPALEVVCRYRYVELITLKTRRPELLVVLLIEALHAFYKFYNQPNCRALKAGTCNYSNLYWLIEVLKKLVTRDVIIT
ncbi:MAG: hypothetical protein LBE20_05185 [Deltaproteobacteria bacterium]|jgi:hypothetical protein|nr:hypothetical protein [Deltaproteobacteria bacterium]